MTPTPVTDFWNVEFWQTLVATSLAVAGSLFVAWLIFHWTREHQYRLAADQLAQERELHREQMAAQEAARLQALSDQRQLLREERSQDAMREAWELVSVINRRLYPVQMNTADLERVESLIEPIEARLVVLYPLIIEKGVSVALRDFTWASNRWRHEWRLELESSGGGSGQFPITNTFMYYASQTAIFLARRYEGEEATRPSMPTFVFPNARLDEPRD